MPPVGLEPTTRRLKVGSTTTCATKAKWSRPESNWDAPPSGAPGFEPGAATNFATRPCARERRWPCSRVAFHCGVSPDRSCPVGSRNGSRSRATVSPVRARASRDEAGIRCLRGILLLCMGGRTRTLNRRFWRPLRYLLRHAHRWLSGNEKPPLTAGAIGGGFALGDTSMSPKRPTPERSSHSSAAPPSHTTA